MGEAFASSLSAQLADLRIFIFIGVFIFLSIVERVVPFRHYSGSFWRRWFTNISLSVMSTLLLRAIPAFAASIAAVYANKESIGLFNNIELPFYLALSIIALDLIIYVQHVLTHKINILWALHQVHHSDNDFDITTGVRFHPIEILLSMGLKCITVIAFGMPLLAVIIFEILLSSCALFAHANISFPKKLDQVLRWVLVTPDMHRIHHSVLRKEHDSNYGTCTSIWDRLFRTYTKEALSSQKEMDIGLTPFKTKNTSSFSWALTLPFKRS